MNNRFKFRAWDKINNKMYKVHSLHIGTGKVIVTSLYGNASIKLDDDKILMQCTGLKDKNGKLIYEGDILGGIYHGYIEYCDECKCFQLKVKDYGCLACDGDLHWYELVEAEEQNELEVIGNIYENKELLEREE